MAKRKKGVFKRKKGVFKRYLIFENKFKEEFLVTLSIEDEYVYFKFRI